MKPVDLLKPFIPNLKNGPNQMFISGVHVPSIGKLYNRKTFMPENIIICNNIFRGTYASDAGSQFVTLVDIRWENKTSGEWFTTEKLIRKFNLAVTIR